MLFDIFFFGFPIAIAICLVVVALREQDRRFWHCAFSFFAYCAFYLAGGREILLYLTCGLIMGHAWISLPI